MKERYTESGTELIADVDRDAALELRGYLERDPFERELEPWEADG